MKYKTSAVVLVFNGNGEMALQMRAADDSSYPLHWDFSAAGGVEEGEKKEDAARRELKEELGIDAPIDYLCEELYQDELVHNKLIIYVAIHNGPFNPDPAEVDEVSFLTYRRLAK